MDKKLLFSDDAVKSFDGDCIEIAGHLYEVAKYSLTRSIDGTGSGTVTTCEATVAVDYDDNGSASVFGHIAKDHQGDVSWWIVRGPDDWLDFLIDEGATPVSARVDGDATERLLPKVLERSLQKEKLFQQLTHGKLCERSCRAIFDLAWEMGHSASTEAVELFYNDLTELVEKCIRIETQD